MNIPWADDEDDKRRQAEMYYTGDDGETVDISLVSISPDPKQVLEKTPPRIVLGELTRQFLLVEREERMRARAPPSKKAEFAKSGPSPTKLKAISMLKQSTGFLARSPGLSAKLGRYERGDIGESFKKRKDYTMGSLEAVQGVVDAPAEESSLAPSIASVETNIDDASISVITKATGAVDSGGGDSVVAKKATSYTNNIGGTGYAEVMRAPHARDLIFASPVKALQMAAQDEERAEEEAKKRRKEEEDKKRRRKRREQERENEERRRANETAVQKVLSPKNLPLSRRIGPTLDQCLRNNDLVYRPDDVKQREFEEILEHIHYKKRQIDATEETKGNEGDSDQNMSMKELGQGAENSAPKADHLGDLGDLLMSEKLYSSYKNTLPREKIESIYKDIADEAAEERAIQRAEEEKRQEAMELLINEAPAYSEPCEWEDKEEEEVRESKDQP